MVPKRPRGEPHGAVRVKVSWRRTAAPALTIVAQWSTQRGEGLLFRQPQQVRHGRHRRVRVLLCERCAHHDLQYTR